MPITFYKNLKIRVKPEVYKPDVDSFLIADNMQVGKGEEVLEIGTGSGFLSILAAKKGGKVVSTDIVDKALDCAKGNAEREGVVDSIDFRKGSMFEPVSDCSFDLIIFNPPYLPVSPEDGLNSDLEKAWDGGENGRKRIDEFLDNVTSHLKPGGRFNFVQSSLSGTEKTLERLKDMKIQFDTVAKKLSFEKLYLFQAETI